MAQEIEIEFKNLLTYEEYKKVRHFFPFPAEPQVQTNYYFETPNFALKEQHSALRIREKEKQFRLTLKEPAEEGLLETHDKLTKQEAYQWLNGHCIKKKNTNKQLINMNIPIDELEYFGKLITKRLEYHEDNLTYVIDESYYNNHTDYELEIEALTYEDGLHAIDYLLKTLNIQKRDTPNKIERFYTTLKNE